MRIMAMKRRATMGDDWRQHEPSLAAAPLDFTALVRFGRGTALRLFAEYSRVRATTQPGRRPSATTPRRCVQSPPRRCLLARSPASAERSRAEPASRDCVRPQCRSSSTPRTRYAAQLRDQAGSGPAGTKNGACSPFWTSPAPSRSLHACGAAGSSGKAGVCSQLASGRLLLERRHREAETALAATVREHLTAALGLHARAEPVRAFATEVVRLVSAFHGENPLERTEPLGSPDSWARFSTGRG